MIDLVTGASGFIGSALAKRLIATGREVRVLLRSGSRRDLLGPEGDGLSIHVADLADPVTLDGAFEDVERVFHCAGRIGFGGRREARLLYDANVRGTAAVLDAASEAGVRRVVHVSSISATGRSPGRDRPVDEDVPWSDTRPGGAYARSKVLAELEAQRAVAEGLDVVIVNPSLVFGPGRSGENTMRIAELVRRGAVWAYPVGSTNVVDVEDVVTGMILAAERGVTGRRYILGAENLSWKEILDTLADAMGRHRPRVALPPPLLTTVGVLAEALAAGRGRTARLAGEPARTASQRAVYDTSRARAELGWNPRPFAETAARIAAHIAP